MSRKHNQSCVIPTLLMAHIMRVLKETYDEYPTFENDGLLNLSFVEDHRMADSNRYGWYIMLAVDATWGDAHWKPEENHFAAAGEEVHRWAAAIDIKRDMFDGSERNVLKHAGFLIDEYNHGRLQTEFTTEDIQELERAAENGINPTTNA